MNKIAKGGVMVENTLTIHDNFLSHEDYSRCWSLIKDGSWRFSGTSNGTGPTFWYMELIENPFMLDLFEKITMSLGLQGKCRLRRLYANGQTYGLDGDFHQDSTDPNDYTFLLYVTNYASSDVDSIGGYTMFKFSNDHIECIEPIANRGVLFSSCIFHKGIAPNRSSYDLRTTIAFKFTIHI